MSENCQASLRCSPDDLREAMSIHTKKITDACRDKDCIEDLRVYLTTASWSCKYKVFNPISRTFGKYFSLS